MSHPNSKNPHLTLSTKNFVDALAAQKGPPLYTLSPQEARQILLDAQSGEVEKVEVQIEDRTLAVGPKGEVAVRIIRPKQASGVLPCIFYFHGGGWIMGNKNTHDRLVRELAVRSRATVIFPSYSPSPEAQYPVPLEESYAVLDYVVKNAKKFAIDPEKVALAGDSVGGNMAIAMALMSAERKGPKICFQLLFYPVTNAAFDNESYQDFSQGPWLTLKAMEWFWNAYCPDSKKRGDILVSPLRAELKQLAVLPPTLLLTAENDVLRDEGEAFAQKLNEAGVQCANLRCNGTIHDFVMLNALAETAPAKAALCLATAALNNMLH